jgi:hypothetical protein
LLIEVCIFESKKRFGAILILGLAKRTQVCRYVNSSHSQNKPQQNKTLQNKTQHNDMSTTYFYIVSEDSGKVLDVHGGNQTDVILYTLHGGQNQQWIIHSNGSIENVAFRGKYLDVSGAAQHDCAKLCVWSWNGGANQQFTIDKKGFIRAKHSNKVLDVKGGNYADCTPIIQYTSHGGSNQKWRLVPVYA